MFCTGGIMKERKPMIGFAGLLLLAVGFCSIALGAKALAVITIGAGAVVLAYALFTGNLKLFG
jgi:hypothetical protein